MATANKTKGSPKKLLTAGKWNLSWKRLLITGSVVVNIAFIVVFISLVGTYSLDGLFMGPGLERYCSSANDDKFVGSTEQIKALRNYVCDTSDAHQYFVSGLDKYLDSKGLSH